MRSDGGTKTGSRGAKLCLLAVAATLACTLVAVSILRGLDDVRWSHSSKPLVSNQRNVSVWLFAMDATAGRARAHRLAPGESTRVLLAGGVLESEFHARIINMLITDAQGNELARASFSGRVGEQIGLVTVANEVRYLGRDERTPVTLTEDADER